MKSNANGKTEIPARRASKKKWRLFEKGTANEEILNSEAPWRLALPAQLKQKRHPRKDAVVGKRRFWKVRVTWAFFLELGERFVV